MGQCWSSDVPVAESSNKRSEHHRVSVSKRESAAPILAVKEKVGPAAPCHLLLPLSPTSSLSANSCRAAAPRRNTLSAPFERPLSPEPFAMDGESHCCRSAGALSLPLPPAIDRPDIAPQTLLLEAEHPFRLDEQTGRSGETSDARRHHFELALFRAFAEPTNSGSEAETQALRQHCPRRVVPRRGIPPTAGAPAAFPMTPAMTPDEDPLEADVDSHHRQRRSNTDGANDSPLMSPSEEEGLRSARLRWQVSSASGPFLSTTFPSQETDARRQPNDCSLLFDCSEKGSFDSSGGSSASHYGGETGGA